MDEYEDEGDITDLSDKLEEAIANCCGHFEKDGIFWCGAAGSEDCDWDCPFSRDIGLTLAEIEARDEADDKQS